MFSTAGLASVWSNYCLKATQIDFTSTQNATMGQPVIDGDSVIERVHGRRADRPILLHHLSRLRGRHGAGMRQREQQSGTGLTRTDWAVNWAYLQKQKTYDFVWGVININFEKGSLCH